MCPKGLNKKNPVLATASLGEMACPEFPPLICYRYFPLNPNMDNPNSWIIQSPSYSYLLICGSACLIGNSLCFQEVYVVLLFRIKRWEIMWSGSPQHVQWVVRGHLNLETAQTFNVFQGESGGSLFSPQGGASKLWNEVQSHENKKTRTTGRHHRVTCRVALC